METRTHYAGRVVRLLILSLIGVLLIILSAISLRRVVLRVEASEPENYLKVLSPTLIYRNNDLTSEWFTLPTGYYAEILSSSGTTARVNYNGVTGFVALDDRLTRTTAPEDAPFQTAEMVTRSDAGTHLRSGPSTEATKLTIIPAGSALEFIGEIDAETPSDGTTATWYYVNFNASATSVFSGYVYGERVEIVSGMEDRTPVVVEEPELAPTEPEPEIPATETDELSVETNISSGLKIFLIILFVTLGLVIFALLLISPKGERKRKLKPVKESPTLVNRNAEFGEYRDEFAPKFPPKKFVARDKSTPLPPALSRFFKVEHGDDNELL